jgi:hypothetical protein
MAAQDPDGAQTYWFNGLPEQVLFPEEGEAGLSTTWASMMVN